MKKTREDKPIEGKYVNYFKVGYNADVIVLDYFQVFPGDEEDAAGVTHPEYRLITSPGDAKQFLAHLERTLAEYEKRYGRISQQPGNG
jgi:hypothetical protein